MPVHIKVIFSLVVLVVAVAGYVFLDWLGQDLSRYLAIFLGLFSVAAFWIFPEVSHKKNKSD
ncbi:MAG: hypothetical protein ACR2PA_14165 [Hyphomicrobiaceae bacterium]